MSTISVKKICFIGAGTMGCFNSLMASIAGYECVIFDPSGESLSSRKDNQRLMADFLSHSNFFNDADIEMAISRIKNEKNLVEALQGADLVSESIPENFDLKISILKKIESLANTVAILTTNTSSLSVKKISEHLKSDTHFAAMHFHLGSRLVDLVRGANTSEDVIESLLVFVKSIGFFPLVLKKENPGYALNPMLGALLSQSMLMVVEGLYSIEEIDGAWKNFIKGEFGPFGMMDMFGLNVVKDSWVEKDNDSSHIIYKERIVGLLSQYTDNNRLGLKNGKGFYDYPNQEDKHDDINYPDIQKDLCLGVIEAALVLLSDDILEKEQINKAWTMGQSLQKGPFDYLDEIGIDTFNKEYSNWIAKSYISSENSQKIFKITII